MTSIISTLLLVAGFIIGLGAVTVIDIHGALGRKSKYWTEATTRTHKVTKPLIWIGMMLFVIGFLFSYEATLLLVQGIVAVVMVLNGVFLSFWVSPYLLGKERAGKAGALLPAYWQRLITISFVVSFISWWGSVVLFVLHLHGIV